MTPTVSPLFHRSLSVPEADERAVLRYARGDDSPETLKLLRRMKKEASGAFSYQVIWRILSLRREGEALELGAFSVFSHSLSEAFAECDRVILFAATVGPQIDRLIRRYSRLSPSKAAMLQALGTERAEALCDAFCREMESDYGPLCPRFSPGYGDLPLTLQRAIFDVLEPSRIGIGLTESLIMTPSKSVTAFVGIPRKKAE
ncbi:MAG: Vitamin B12 dependent methionine synthase activation subunit [Clostridia bacterium]|nr:Vitamin B12 dependent methionine synthase activation subunit [Clostridia bacterium]